MKYLLDVFSPSTWQKFYEIGQGVTGFSTRYRHVAKSARKDDVFLCYMTQLSRWCGALRIASECYEDDSPLFGNPEIFVVRFQVEPLIVLDFDFAIPIHSDHIWNTLSMTRGCAKGESKWTGFFRKSLNEFREADGEFLFNELQNQNKELVKYSLSDQDRRRIKSRISNSSRIKLTDVSAPHSSAESSGSKTEYGDIKESTKVQSSVALLGIRLGYQVWVPPSDKRQVLSQIATELHASFLNSLPMNFADRVLTAFQEIDVLWLNKNAVIRAFEIEHTTAVYSGLLRMADLLALLPNLNIQLHIVAPEERRKKVFREINRPVFANLQAGPLAQKCTYLSYKGINELVGDSRLPHMHDSIIETIEENTQE